MVKDLEEQSQSHEGPYERRQINQSWHMRVAFWPISNLGLAGYEICSAGVLSGEKQCPSMVPYLTRRLYSLLFSRGTCGGRW